MLLLNDWRVALGFALVAAIVIALREVQLRRELKDRETWLKEIAERQQERVERRLERQQEREERERREREERAHRLSLEEWLERSGLADRMVVGRDGRLHAISESTDWWS